MEEASGTQSELGRVEWHPTRGRELRVAPAQGAGELGFGRVGHGLAVGRQCGVDMWAGAGAPPQLGL